MTTSAIVWRPQRGRVRVRMPYAPGNRRWLREVCGAATRPEWCAQHGAWHVARPHFRAVVAALAEVHSSVRVLVDQATTRACGPACQDAQGDECECQCLGVNHGGARASGWVRAGERWLVRHQVVRIEYLATAPPNHESERKTA